MADTGYHQYLLCQWFQKCHVLVHHSQQFNFVSRTLLSNQSYAMQYRIAFVQVGSEEKVKALARRALDIVARNPSPPTSRISQSESLLSRMNAHQPVKSDHVSEVHGMAQRVIPAGKALAQSSTSNLLFFGISGLHVWTDYPFPDFWFISCLPIELLVWLSNQLSMGDRRSGQSRCNARCCRDSISLQL